MNVKVEWMAKRGMTVSAVVPSLGIFSIKVPGNGLVEMPEKAFETFKGFYGKELKKVTKPKPATAKAETKSEKQDDAKAATVDAKSAGRQSRSTGRRNAGGGK